MSKRRKKFKGSKSMQVISKIEGRFVEEAHTRLGPLWKTGMSRIDPPLRQFEIFHPLIWLQGLT